MPSVAAIFGFKFS